MDFIFGYREAKLKPYLKMGLQRLAMAQNKKQNGVKVQKREIAVLLSNGKEESARIKVEHVIRQDYEIECFELIQLYLELLLERVRIITHDDTCPHELLVPVATVLWCADRIDIEELQQVKRQFGLKYGSKFVKECAENESLMVSDKVITKLSIRPPTAYLVQEYLKEIAKEYKVQWAPKHSILPDDPAFVSPPTGFSTTNRLPPPPPPSQEAPPSRVPPPHSLASADEEPPAYEELPVYETVAGDAYSEPSSPSYIFATASAEVKVEQAASVQLTAPVEAAPLDALQARLAALKAPKS